MKKIIPIFLFLVFLLISCDKSPIVELKLSEVHPEGYPTTLADHEFASLVKKRTNGRVIINVYAEGSLYNEESKAIEALQKGEIAFARVSISPVAAYVPELNALQMPYLYESSEHMWNVLNNKIGINFLNDLETSDSGLIGLCYYEAGSRCFYSNKPIKSVEEMKGLRIRVMNSPMMIRMVELLGGIPIVNIGLNDVYTSLQNNVIDCAENNISCYQNNNDYEVAENYILDHHTRIPEILLASSKALEGLKESDIKIIKKCAKETQAFEIEQWNKKESMALNFVRAKGTNIIELSDSEITEFQKAVKPLYDEFGSDYSEIIKNIKNLGK